MLCLRLSHHQRRNQIFVRTLYDGVASIKCPRDRGLDHAVARESHLKPLLNLKDLIISEPSKSIPLSLIVQTREALEIPFRPIEFIRKYPSIFQEFNPGSLDIQPHIKLSPEIVSLNSEETLLYQSIDYKQEVANRLLKLLMISRINKIPIFLIEKLRWELGLPRDYEKTIIPNFPDYFRVINGKELELVCWSDDFAVSVIEKKVAKDGKIQFPLQYTKDFEMDKKYKKWVDDWQKLPYISPYENAAQLAAKTDESDKWAVAILHELLNLFVGKKGERENLLYLGEYLGLRSRFKLAFLQHPGIFYVSNKVRMHMVVLKEAYKRGMLIERNPLMGMRSKYVKLMNVVVKGESKSKSKTVKQKTGNDTKKGEEKESDDDERREETDESGEENDVEMNESSDDDDDYSDDSDDEDEDDENASERGKYNKKAANFEIQNPKGRVERGQNGRSGKDHMYASSTRFSRRTNTRDDRSQSAPRRDARKFDEGDNFNKRGGRFDRKADNFEEKGPRRSVRRTNNSNESYSPSSFSRRSNVRDDHCVPRRDRQRKQSEV